jgi:hypothetical protein
MMPTDRIDRAIRLVRGQKVMLDSDLAALYGVQTFNLNKAVARNRARFPDDFMFQLTREEFQALTFQFGISKRGRGGRRTPPYAFTEQGVAMLSSVLRSERAVRVNVEIMRAFVRLRSVLATHSELARQLRELEKRVGGHDEQFAEIIQAIRDLMQPPPERKRKPIGYLTEAEGSATKKARATQGARI